MLFRGASLLFLGVGIFILVQVVMPFVSYKFWEVTSLQQASMLVDPYPIYSNILGVSVKSENSFPAFISNAVRSNIAPYKQFELVIPSINLDWGKVVVDTNDFENNLALLPGTALPGERGNVFITGHSSLTQLYKQDNYKAIFAHLPDVKRGDTINISAAEVKYVYIVEGIKIVDPKDVSVIQPPDSYGRYLTLMTCVPPGFNTKRLIVLARLK